MTGKVELMYIHQVKVGNERVIVGYVFYKTNLWQTNLPFRISIIVLMVVVGVAFIAVLISFLVTKFNLKERLENSGGHARYAEQSEYRGLLCGSVTYNIALDELN